MNSVLVDLKMLQEMDDQIRLDKKYLGECEAELTKAGAGLKAREDKLEAARQKVEAMKSRHRELEAEVADLAVKLKNNGNRQMAVKNNNEYAALLKEAEYLSTRQGALEDETLDLLDQLEKWELEISRFVLLVNEEAATYARLAVNIEVNLTNSNLRLDKLETSRKALVESLPPDQLRRYDEIAKKKAGRAVTAAVDGLCLACRLGFPPQIFNELQRNEKIIICPNCDRIIYWQDHPDFKPQEEADGVS